MDKPTAKQIRLEVEAALRVIGQNHGLVFKMGNIRYTSNSLRTVLIANEGTSVVDAEKADFERRAYQMGAQPDWWGKIFRHKGANYRVRSLTSRRSRYPVIAEELVGAAESAVATGRKLRFPLLTVSQQIGFLRRAHRSMLEDETINSNDVGTIDMVAFSNRHED